MLYKGVIDQIDRIYYELIFYNDRYEELADLVTILEAQENGNILEQSVIQKDDANLQDNSSMKTPTNSKKDPGMSPLKPRMHSNDKGTKFKKDTC